MSTTAIAEEDTMIPSSMIWLVVAVEVVLGVTYGYIVASDRSARSMVVFANVLMPALTVLVACVGHDGEWIMLAANFGLFTICEILAGVITFMILKLRRQPATPRSS